jgi:hypothetical protein
VTGEGTGRYDRGLGPDEVRCDRQLLTDHDGVDTEVVPVHADSPRVASRHVQDAEPVAVSADLVGAARHGAAEPLDRARPKGIGSLAAERRQQREGDLALVRAHVLHRQARPGARQVCPLAEVGVVQTAAQQLLLALVTTLQQVVRQPGKGSGRPVGSHRVPPGQVGRSVSQSVRQAHHPP